MKKIFILLFSLSLFCFHFSFAQSNFYTEDTIQIIEITFPYSNWDYRMDTAKVGADGYTLATAIKINGVIFDSVGVRYKGNSSYDSTQQKNPVHIKLDFVHSNSNYNGIQDVKISNGFSDPSSVREVLAYHVLRSYMDEPQSNFAKLYINGIYYGVYSNSENIDGNFLDHHFYSSDKTFVKGNPESVINGHIPNLTYLGTDSSLYYDRYELKSDYAWKDLVNLCDAIVNAPVTVDSFLDVDRALWMLAFNDVTVNLDSYSGQFAQNYYLYRDHNNRFNPIIWDLNMCFGSFTGTGSANLNLSQMQQLTPLLHATNASRPLIKNLLADSTYLKMYLAHARTINNEFFANGNYQSLAQNFQSLIDTSVQAENFSLYTYPEFQNSLTTSVGSVPGIAELMDARATYLNGTSQFQQTPPAISSVTANPATPVFGSTVTVHATVSNTQSVYLGFRYKKSDRFVRIHMFDDGAHNDGASGDNVFGISIPVSSLEIQYYIYAENSIAGMFSPERAEHEFYFIHPSITYATTGDIAINEFEANNTTGITNEDGRHKDWIELYNKTNSDLGLKNLFLSDDIQDLQKWKIPDIAFIPAHGYLLVWADDKDSLLLECHSNFNLNEIGDSLFLVNASSQFSDSTVFSTATANVSTERCPDGTGSFQLTVTPTPRSTNCPSGIGENISEETPIVIFPNPVADKFNYSVNGNFNLNKIEIKNLLGQRVFDKSPESNQPIDISFLSSGIYFVSFIDLRGTKQVLKIVKD